VRTPDDGPSASAAGLVCAGASAAGAAGGGAGAAGAVPFELPWPAAVAVLAGGADGAGPAEADTDC